MKKLLLMIFLSGIIIFSTFALVVSVSAYSYTLKTYVSDSTATPLSINGMGLKYNDCFSSLNQRVTATGSAYSITTTLFSPDSTNVGVGTLTGQNNISCKTTGTSVTNFANLDGIYEGRSEIVLGGDNVISTLENKYVCDSADYWIDLYTVPSSDIDFNGNVANRFFEYYEIAAASPFLTTNEITDLAIQSNYSNCGSFLEPTPYVETIYSGCSGTCAPNKIQFIFYYPFNSTQGYVNYSIAKFNGTNPFISITDNCAGSAAVITANVTLYLVDIIEETIQVLTNEVNITADNIKTIGGINQFWSGAISLEKNKNYMFVLEGKISETGSHTACTTSGISIEPAFNISVYVYAANFTCGEWSECEDGMQTKTCYDVLGVSPPEINFQTCDIVVLQNATLGFEEYYTDFALKCVPGWFFGCSYYIQNITRDTPIGWMVSEDYFNEGLQRDFLRMSADWSSEGSRSLKMWYIPPKNGEPTDNATCGNATYGIVPAISQIVSNSTFYATYNVEFPATNMLLSLDVKGCNEQVSQHDAIKTLFDVITLCPDACYAGNCSTIPDSEFQIFLRDASGVILTNYYGEASIEEAKKIQMDLTGIGIVPGQNYTIQIQALPENLNSQSGNCVLFDNVKYEVLENPYLDIIGGDCSVGNKCVGTTLYETHLYENGACSVVRTDVSPACVTGENKERIIEKLDYCEDTGTLKTFNLAKASWESVECDYICFENECMTQDDYINATTTIAPDTPETANDYLAIFFSAAFITSFLVLILCVFVGIKMGGDAWPIPLFGIAQIIFILSIFQVIPLIFAIGEVLLAAVIAAYFISKMGSG